mgnify:CR=1 FL=1|tara:strand:- start:8026 stop:9540 length:1515 start_codon:yes stop_codon:yes gene_type:complete
MKILENYKEIKKFFLEVRKNNNKIVFCHGVFDVLHLGHIRHFQEAKKKGDILVVSVTSDKFVNKGFGRPYHSLKVRMQTLEALNTIDYIIPSYFSNAEHNLSLVQPNIYCKGPDYKQKPDITENLKKEKDTLKTFSGKMHFTSDIVLSSSSLINSFKDAFNERQRKFLDIIKKKYTFEDIKLSLNKLEKLNVYVLGEVILDQYTFCEPIGISGKDPFIVFNKKKNNLFAGGSFAIAKNISNFVNSSNLVSILPKQKKNINLLLRNKPKNLKLEKLNFKSSKEILKNRFIDSNTSAKIFGLYSIDDNELTKIDKKKLISFLKKAKKKSNNFIISDYGHGFINKEISDLVSTKGFNYTLNAQINSANRGFHGLFKYKKSNSIIINESELRYEFKDKYSTVESLIIKLSNRLKSKVIVVTRGSEGAISYSKKEGFLNCPAFYHKIVDKVGAGDALLGVFSLCKFAGLENDLSLFLSSISGGYQTSIINNESFLDKISLLKQIDHILK